MRSLAGLMMLVVATILMIESCICAAFMIVLTLGLAGIGLLLLNSVWAPKLQRFWGAIKNKGGK